MVNEIQEVFLTNGRDWLAIFVEALVPVAIMLFTLHSEKKRHRESLRQQAEEHKIELSAQKESTRLAILPIFNLVGMTATNEVMTLSSGVTLDKHIFTLHLENVGGGVAMSPFIKWNEIDGVILNHPFDETDTAYYCCYKDIPYENMVATPGKSIEIQIIRKPKGMSIPIEDHFVLPIDFTDVLRNKYEQQIVVQFYILKDKNVAITNVYTNAPVLLEDSEQSAGK